MEEWRKYKDTNYEVSNLGNVRSFITKKTIKPFLKHYGKHKNDYLKVSLYVNKKNKSIFVHRMVAECFLENYADDLEVNHKNSIRYDNRVENLEMTTKEENYQHSLIYGNGSQRKPTIGIDNEGNIERFESLWAAAKFIKKKYSKNIEIDNICTNIKQSIKGKTKYAYGYKWIWSE